MPDEKRVLFLPGAAGAGTFWTPVMARLPATWRLEALDLPGLGNVPARSDVASYSDLVEYVAARITGPAALVAQSMGAYVALEIVLGYPHTLTHLVLVAATGGIDLTPPGAAEWRNDYGAAFPDAQAWACEPVPDLTARLAEITIPVLLLWATADDLSPMSVAHALASRIPVASLVSFDSNDHWFARQAADRSADAIRSFIANSRSDGGTH